VQRDGVAIEAGDEVPVRSTSLAVKGRACGTEDETVMARRPAGSEALMQRSLELGELRPLCIER
jgi:hypothetical protein